MEPHLGRWITCANIGFHSVTENIDLQSVGGKVVVAVLGAMAEGYIDNLSAETSKGKRQRAKEGFSNASIIPYGYQKSETGDIIPEPYEAEAIRSAFRSYASGKYTDAMIAGLLNDAGYRTRYTTQFGSRPWTKDTVCVTLKNVFYIGKVRHGNEVFEGKHEALVSRELWERAQAIRSERYRNKKTAAPCYRVYLLNGIVRCSVCRQTLRVQRSAGHSYYRHTSLVRGIACSEPDVMVREERLADQIDEFVNRLSIPDDW
jgi:site-specific DNA recombinase